MKKSDLNFSFDKRVSETYDQVRAHPESVSKQIGQSIASIAGPAARILELGIGTGRIALPTIEAGCDVVGVDLSEHMLNHVVNSATGRGLSISVVQADIGRLPFAENTFDAVTAIHVLHLVPDWRNALADAAAALKPQGCMILGRDWTDPDCMAGRLQDQFRRVVVELMGPQLKAPTSGAVIAQTIEEFGGKPINLGPTDVVAAEWMTDTSPAEFVTSIREKTFPESWVLTDEYLDSVSDRIEFYAETHWPDLSQPQPVKRRFLLSVFRGEFDDAALV